MPDTHDDGRVPLRQRSIPDQLDHFGNKLGGLLDRANLDRDMLIAIGAAVVNLGAIAAQLRKQGEHLAAATARAEKAEAVIAADDSLDYLAKLVIMVKTDSAAEIKRLRAEVAAAAAPGRALSTTETDADGVRAYREGSNSSATAAELSERCRVTKLDEGVRHHCDSDAPHDTHECGDCAHRWDDTTEDGQHG